MNGQIHPPSVSRTFVLAKCDYFASVHLWPLQSRVNPELWLSNFREAELDHAIHLLNAFLYFSHDLTVELFKAAFRSLASRIGGVSSPYLQADNLWRQFRNSREFDRSLLANFPVKRTAATLSPDWDAKFYGSMRNKS